MYAPKKPGNKLGYWLFFFLSFHWTNYRVLKTAEFPSSINLSLDYFTAAAYLPVALLLCGSNCCLALRWNASENRFFPIKLSPSKLPLQKPSAATLLSTNCNDLPPQQFYASITEEKRLLEQKSMNWTLQDLTTHHSQGKQITKDDSWVFCVTECWKICGDFF